jgi:hypothetical protein
MTTFSTSEGGSTFSGWGSGYAVWNLCPSANSEISELEGMYLNNLLLVMRMSGLRNYLLIYLLRTWK